MQELNSVNPASFRDPNGFVFTKNGILYRQIQPLYREHYDHLMQSGLYERLTKDNLLLPHQETAMSSAWDESAYKVIQPSAIPFISYPYEWCFGELKDAALTTLAIQKQAMQNGMILKDASAFNIQFVHGKPVLIDTLSFEIYKEGEPWIAYRQFCQHFLAPLALMSYKDIRLVQLLRIYIDGIPMDLADAILPFGKRFKPSMFTHVHLHAKTQKRYATKAVVKNKIRISSFQLRALIDSLESAIQKLEWEPEGTEWGEYYDCTNYTEKSFENKREAVGRYLDIVKPDFLWDLGANTGVFSRLASSRGTYTISFDLDPAAVEKNYRLMKQTAERNLLPLLVDLTNPSPGLGYENKERSSLEERGPVNAVLALALVHHLAISNNVPLIKIAAYFARICKSLIIEFVPKSDSQVQRLLATRQDIFPNYTQEGFEKDFSNYFSIQEKTAIRGSERTLYLMRVP